MIYRREALLVKRISFFVRDSRDLREKRDWSETSSSRVALVAPFARISLTSCERRDTRYERRARCQAGR